MNLDKLGKPFEIKSRDLPEEVQARLQREQDDAVHQRGKDFALFIIVTTMVCVVACACLWIALNPSYSPDHQRTALSLLTVIVSASMGYLTGKSSK